MTTYYALKYKEPIHIHTYTVAIAVDSKNMVAVDSSGDLVPAADGTAAAVVGAALESGAVGETVRVMSGLLAFDNDGTTAVTAAGIGTIGKVGADAANISVSSNAGVLTECGRIKYIDAEGQVWIDTEDR